MLFTSLWGRIPESYRYEIVSGLNTIAAAIGFELVVQITKNEAFLDPTQLSHGLLYGLGLALVRVAWKTAITYTLSRFGFPLKKR